MSTGHNGYQARQITRLASHPVVLHYIYLIFNLYQFSIMAYSTNTPAGQTVQEIIDSLPGLMAVAVVDIQSGMALASHSNSPGLNPETAAAYNTEVVKQKQKAMSALKLTNEKIDDILITLSNQIHLLNLSDDGKKFIYLVVNSRDTNLAIARDVCRQGAEFLK
jgi:hypothetical protein